MTAPSPALTAPEWLSDWIIVSFWLTLEQPGEAFETGEIHSRRECRSDRDHHDPEQPLADGHLIPGVAPGCERQWQGRRESDGPLLGPETGPPGLPCAVSVPNLSSDRGLWVAG